MWGFFLVYSVRNVCRQLGNFLKGRKGVSCLRGKWSVSLEKLWVHCFKGYLAWSGVGWVPANTPMHFSRSLWRFYWIVRKLVGWFLLSAVDWQFSFNNSKTWPMLRRQSIYFKCLYVLLSYTGKLLFPKCFLTIETYKWFGEFLIRKFLFVGRTRKEEVLVCWSALFSTGCPNWFRDDLSFRLLADKYSIGKTAESLRWIFWEFS